MIDERSLRDLLVRQWGLPDPRIERHDGGMNSSTWFVTVDRQRWVAKAVSPAARRSFAAGLLVATELEAAGIPAGAPVLTKGQEQVVAADGVPLALLTWVPGEGLSGADPGEQRLLGVTLARVHELIRDVRVADLERFHWVEPEARHLALRPWLRPMAADAVAAVAEPNLGPLAQGLLHTDPAPGAFRLDRTSGVCGLIDWSVAMLGPLLYDLASAVMYVGGPDRAGPLVAAYLERGIVSRSEAERGLVPMLRFRWAVQADYFARRISSGDLTGVTDSAENEAGLEHARQWLRRLSG